MLVYTIRKIKLCFEFYFPVHHLSKGDVMKKAFVISCLTLIALFFTSANVYAQQQSDEAAIRACIEKNIQATQNEDLDAFWETCKLDNAQFRKQTEFIMNFLFETYDLSYKIDSYKLISNDGKTAAVEVVMTTKKIRGPEFQDNQSKAKHTLKKIDGKWYIVGSNILDVVYLKPSTAGNPETKNYYKQNIVKVIKRDCQLSSPLNAAVPNAANLSENEKFDRRSQQIYNYVRNAKKSLNYDELPSDFVSAYISHLNAWDQKGMKMANHPDLDTWSNIADVLVHDLFGDVFHAFDLSDRLKEYISQLKQIDSKIATTWQDVEAVAIKYGVNVSQYQE